VGGSPSLEGIKEVGFSAINMWDESRKGTSLPCTLLTGMTIRTLFYSLSLRSSVLLLRLQVLWQSALWTHTLCIPVSRTLPLPWPRVQLPGKRMVKSWQHSYLNAKGEMRVLLCFPPRAHTCLFTFLLWIRAGYILNLLESYLVPL